eukprot:CAMPEP_0115483828 /NCGR_PEP_ID=MMETSP0271-20121206/59057_1 /TAXON_ID=71861 /ORGANISM="Scrippsiella trochoidea, Strain CCMP3099" /LENGTH=49 /DNA_ID=CAMNT_0002911691 /DNA_START=215 /DNA_END=364 /DNA_ORIENTATION=-
MSVPLPGPASWLRSFNKALLSTSTMLAFTLASTSTRIALEANSNVLSVS